MKGKRKLAGVLMIIAALVIMQLPVSEADAATSASDFKMEGSTLVKYRGTEKNVSIPDTVEVIGESAFENNSIIELVVVPNSVKRIEAYAFWGCDRLETVVLGTGLMELGDYSFTNCKGLKHMSIPSNVRTVGIQTFADCVNMTDITIPPEVTQIHETSFDGCAKLIIHCETGSFADKYSAEFYEKQKEMPEYEDVPDYSETDDTQDNENDGDENTDNANTDSGNAGNSSVPAAEDSGKLLGTTQVVRNQAVVFIDNTSPVVRDGSEAVAELASQNGTPEAFQKAEDGNLPKYTIVDGKIVADQAYYKSKDLTKVTLPGGITEIGQFAFARSSLTEIEVPEGTTGISYGAFYHCNSLGSVSLPSTIEVVEPKAFEHTPWVENFLQSGAEEFLISGNTLVAYGGAGPNVVIPEGVTVIAGEAFMGDNRISSVVFPESLRVIGEGAFENCSGLTEIQMGTQITDIKDRAFAGCPISIVSLPASVQNMGLQIFDERTTVTYPEGLTPNTTHESSAERLSNDRYRNTIAEESTEPGVTVEGIAPALALLDGAAESYLLTISASADKSNMEKAYRRCYLSELQENSVVYDLLLTDQSNIPITRLGKQNLTVTMPVPEAFSQENIELVTLDRNGQLVTVNGERVMLDGVDAVRFQTAFVASVGIYSEGSAYNYSEETVEEVSTVIQDMSAGPIDGTGNTSYGKYFVFLKWSASMMLLVLGSFYVIRKGKRR